MTRQTGCNDDKIRARQVVQSSVMNRLDGLLSSPGVVITDMTTHHTCSSSIIITRALGSSGPGMEEIGLIGGGTSATSRSSASSILSAGSLDLVGRPEGGSLEVSGSSDSERG